MGVCALRCDEAGLACGEQSTTGSDSTITAPFCSCTLNLCIIIHVPLYYNSVYIIIITPIITL